MILGAIPAGGGSKGIPRRNIRELLGYPLIWWSIQSAKESKRLDRFVVSTEDEEITAISRSFGAEVLPRPASLASDEATVTNVLQHVLEHIEADIVVLLVPTSPVRANNIVDRAVALFVEKDVDSLATGYMCKYDEWGTVPEILRQEKRGYFIPDGCVYVHKAEVILSGNWYGQRLERMVVPRYYNFDVDDEADL